MKTPPFCRRDITLASLFVLSILLLACESRTGVRTTNPANGQTGVDPRAVVAIRLSNTTSDADANLGDTELIQVTGEIGGRYDGIIELADWREVMPGQTIEEFNDRGVPAPGLTVREETSNSDESRLDTLVFLLPAGVTYKPGERVNVFVSHDVTAHGAPLQNSVKFSFTVSEAGSGTDIVRISATDPAPAQFDAALARRVRATFSMPVTFATLDAANSVTIRGSQTGVHSDVQNVVTQASGAAVLEVSHRLDVADAFAPGETVEVAWSDAIQAPLVAGETMPQSLLPHVLRFQAATGRVNGGWSEANAPEANAPAVRVLSADWIDEEDQGDFPASEFVVVTVESVELYTQELGLREWKVARLAIDATDGDDRFDVIDAAVFDLDRDGHPQVVVLLSHGSGSQLQLFSVASDGTLEVDDDVHDFPAREAVGLAVADLDANGDREIIVFHPERSVATGTTTLFEVTEGMLEISDIDPLDPSSAVPPAVLSRIDDAFPNIEPAVGLDFGDLNGNGLLDVVASMDDGRRVVYRNLSSTAAPYALRMEGELSSATGGNLDAQASVIADIDLDGDLDVIAWDGSAALLYRNGQDSGEQGMDLLSRIAAVIPEDVPELATPLSGPAHASALDFDGDRVVDFIVARPSGDIDLFLGISDFAYTPVTLAQSGSRPIDLTIADLDRDSGLDAIVVEAGSREPLLRLADGVTPPETFSPSSFEIAPVAMLDESSEFLSSIEGDTLRVVVVGDFTTRFTGYDLSLDYDESVLNFVGFESPPAFDGLATFTTCPDVSRIGCSGNAAASMRYSQSTTRGRPVDDVLVGTFIFTLPTVIEPTVTEIQLTDFTVGSATFRNGVMAFEDNASIEVSADVVGVPLSLSLLPPPPEDLTISCEVTQRDPADMNVLVSWDSPSGRVFDSFELFVNGLLVTTLGGGAIEFMLTDLVDIGRVPIDVVGRTVGLSNAIVSCEVVGIHAPVVQCLALSTQENRITWSFSDTVDRFQIFRNGNPSPIGQVTGASREFRDVNPTFDGADLYEVAAVLDNVTGPSSQCSGGAVGDPSDDTLPPTITAAGLLARAEPSSPNALRLRWSNGEGYASIEVAVRVAGSVVPEFEDTLVGTAVEFIYEGNGPGGVAPNLYEFTVVGVGSSGRASAVVTSTSIAVLVPELDVDLDCAVVGNGDIHLDWQSVWAGYSELKIVVRSDNEAPVETVIDLGNTSFTLSSPSPVGTYTFNLVATFSGIIPDSLQPFPGALTQTCRVSFDSQLVVGNVQTGVGLTQVEIPVRAKVLTTVTGFAFSLEYPDFFEVDSATGVVVADPDAQLDVTFEGAGAGRRRAVVEVQNAQILPDQDGDGTADGDIVIALLVGDVPEDFSVAGEYNLTFGANPTIRSTGSSADLPVRPEDGQLEVVGSYVAMDFAEVDAGSSEIIMLTALATFADARINSFQLHVTFDPTQLEVLPIDLSDQTETIWAGTGLPTLPNASAVAAANSTGELKTGWLGFDLSNASGGFTFIDPGIMLNLMTFRFRSRLAATDPSVFAVVDLLTETSDLPTALFPEDHNPNSVFLEATFPGGILILGEDEVSSGVTLTSVQPNVGSLLGGNTVTLRGNGFLGLQASDFTLRVEIADSVEHTVPTGDIVSVSVQSVRFVMPDSAIRAPLSGDTFRSDIHFDLDGIRTTLFNGYSYEAPLLDGSSRSSGLAAGGDSVTLSGRGFAPQGKVSVDFVFANGDRFAAIVSSVAADGRSLTVTTPSMPGHESDDATIEVSSSGLPVASRSDLFTVTPASGLVLSSVTPTLGTICGGTGVTLSGNGFEADLEVRFLLPGATILIDSTTVSDSSTAQIVTPVVPEGTGAISIELSLGGETVRVDNVFTYTHPAPVFTRGDVNVDGKVDTVDGIQIVSFLGGQLVNIPANLDALDADDDGDIDQDDALYILDFFTGVGSAPPPPFSTPGLDPTPDNITSCP